MGKLELKPPLLLITMGYPGSGKSFFARQFGEQYSLPVLSDERIRFELFENPQFNNDESDIVSRVFDYALEQLMRTGSSLVCDGSFLKLKDRQRIQDQAKKAGFRTLTVWLQTDINTSNIRARRRDRRNPDSKYAFDLNAVQFKNISESLQRPNDKEKFVVISGKHAFKGQSLTVLRKITDMYALELTKSANLQNNRSI